MKENKNKIVFAAASAAASIFCYLQDLYKRIAKESLK